jgi:TRAP-type C4-dicarboxylate transport system permease small subunit
VLRLSFLRKIAKIIIPALMLVVLCYLANASMNQHSHQLSSGIMVNHAHPFEKKDTGNPSGDHHHTRLELILLEQISVNYFWIYLAILFIFPFFLTLSDIIIREKYILRSPYLYFLNNYHAPPETIN